MIAGRFANRKRDGYGKLSEDATDSPGIQLGGIALRGERGVLQMGALDILRLRWNPFDSYLERRVIEFLKLASTPN